MGDFLEKKEDTAFQAIPAVPESPTYPDMPVVPFLNKKHR